MSEHALPHVTLAGVRSGGYRIAEERPDGTRVLRPDTSADAIFQRLGAEQGTLADLEAEHGPIGQPDGEG